MRRRVFALCVVLLVLLGAVAFGQTSKGNIYGIVTDNEGETLPGVTVTLSGMGADKTQMTNAQGQFRFLGLDVGAYAVKADLEGFGITEYPGLLVQGGRNTSIEVSLSPAVEETITVTSESPLLDERKLLAGTTVSQVELEKIPTGRDPWSLLSQTPGVSVDRINVGGNEGGQQSTFRAQGVSGDENDFQMDGTSITDMRAVGASPTYYDFDQFAEVSFTTGGSDITKNTAGVQVNMVTKRGTNEFRGSARFLQVQTEYFNHIFPQSSPNISGELARSDGQDSLTGSSISKIQEVGFEAGGALVRDRAWLWGSFGQSNIGLITAAGSADDTILENVSLKANVQFSPKNSAVGSYNNGDKVKKGRAADAFPNHTNESLWDQRGPSAIDLFEDTHVFSSNLFLTATWAHNDFGFELLARGQSGNGLAPGELDPSYIDGIWVDNFLSGGASSYPDEYKVDVSYFFNSGNTNHELKIGGRFRDYTSESNFAWGPRNVFHADWGSDVATHGPNGPATAEYTSIWVQDTITVGKATINAGLRYDAQDGYNEAATVAPHAVFPDVLPGYTVAKSKNISWESITPRIGITYALGEDRDTLLRGSFSQFADQLSTALGGWTSPTYYHWYAYFYGGTAFEDMYAATYFDPLNPTVGANRFGANMDPPTTNEIIVGVEHALLPEFVVGFNLMARSATDILDQYQMVRDGNGGVRPATFADYELVGNLTGSIPRGGPAYSVPFYDLVGQLNVVDSAAGAPSGGLQWVNGDRERNYFGGTLTATKRLSNRWMMRGYINWGEDEWDVPNASRFAGCPGGAANNARGGGCRDGDTYTERSTGSGKGERFLQSSWSFSVNGMYQVAPDRPWGFNVSGAINGREGHAIPYYHRTGSTLGLTYLTVGKVDDYRLDDPITADLRIEKEFGLTSAVNLTFGIDAFNITNEGTGLAYNPRTNTSSAGFLQDNVSPRVYRMGVRLSWR